MTMTRAALVGGVTLAAVAVGWLAFAGVPSWTRARSIARTQPVATPAPPTQGRKIKAQLFYVAEDGMRLTSLERDVPYGEGTVEQAKAIVTAQIAPAAPPLVSAVPPGTTLRALFVTPEGEAYVDFSRELMAAQPGGSLNELLTVYTIVNVLTANLPIVTGVQLLVDGKEIDTLSGHVDLRRPLAKDLAWVETATP